MSKTLILGYAMNPSLPTITREDAENLTHINLAFGLIADGVLDMSGLSNIGELHRIRSYNKDLRFVLSVGGWGAGGFSTMAKNAEGRARFVSSCIDVVRTHNLDGIDIDWEYPCMDLAGIDCDAADKQNFTLLLHDLRRALGDDKIVSIAAGAGDYFIENTHMDEVAAVCDYVQLMTYDIRSGFHTQAGHHANLYTAAGDEFDGSMHSTVSHYIASGVPRGKIVVGAAFYARRWEGVPDVNHGLHQPAATTGMGGPGYAELVRSYIGKNNFVRYYDESAQAPYLFDGSTFISYDDADSVAKKVQYVQENQLLGIMYWEHGSDPSRVLLSAISKQVHA